MTESIIVALITGVVTLAGVLIANAKSDAVQNERIDQLRDEVAKHNKVVERVFLLEGRADRADDEFHRINERLKNGGL